jgi:putative membrane protein
MSSALRAFPTIQSLGAFALVASLVTPAACRSHEVTSHAVTVAESPAAMGTEGSSGAVHVATKAAASPSAPEEGPPFEPTSILSKLHQTDLMEIEMGKMAEKDGNSKEVKDYGSRLVHDHTAADKRIMAFAKVEHISIATLSDKNEEMQMKLQPGPEFDTDFAKQMMRDHQHDIAKVTEARDATRDIKLKGLLSSLLPVLKKHEEIAQKIIDHADEHK